MRGEKPDTAALLELAEQVDALVPGDALSADALVCVNAGGLRAIAGRIREACGGRKAEPCAVKVVMRREASGA